MLRYGDVPLVAGGTLIPTSTALLFPDRDGTEAQLSALYATQILEKKFALSFGRFNFLDAYSAHPFTGGEGIDRFMNLSFVAPPVSARTIPPVAEGVMFSYLYGGRPAVTVGLIESTEDGFFENGATLMWNVGLPVKLSKTKPGGISVGGEFSSFEGTSLSQNPWVFIPELDVPLAEERGTWTFNVSVDQFTWMHPNDPTKGVGVFGMLAFSDGNPSLLKVQAFAGVGGASPFEGRSMDSFGIGLFLQRHQRRLRGDPRAVPPPFGFATSRAPSCPTPGRRSGGAASPPISRSSIRFSDGPRRGPSSRIRWKVIF